MSASVLFFRIKNYTQDNLDYATFTKNFIKHNQGVVKEEKEKSFTLLTW